MTDSTRLQVDRTEGITLSDVVIPLRRRFRWLVAVPIAAGVLAFGATYLIAPTFTASTSFLPPPQPQNSAAASALASLGALSGLAGTGGLRTPGDQYVALMQSRTVSDRLIDRFSLMQVYGSEMRFQARQRLQDNVQIALGKRDGIISVAVDDHDPERAAAIANQYVVELRKLTGALVLTEAEQRRAFFERELNETKDRLTQAQRALEGSGFSSGALRAEPRAAAEQYARVRTEVTAAEVRLQTLRRSLADSAPEIQRQQAELAALRRQLQRLEATAPGPADADYIGRYREFKYQEGLYDLFSRQYELARLDESRENAQIQVIDSAVTPEWKSRPKRALVALIAAVAALGLVVLGILFDALRPPVLQRSDVPDVRSGAVKQPESR